MLALDKYSDLNTQASVPNVGSDLVAAQEAGHFRGLPAERLMVVLELLRHQEITEAQAAAFASVSEGMLRELMQNLQISVD